MTELQQIRALLEAVLRELDQLKKALAPKRPPLTRKQFADATGYSYKTICRKVDAKEIRLVDGRIPASELDKFLT